MHSTCAANLSSTELQDLETAAIEKNAEAMISLGRICESGSTASNRDEDQAFGWYYQAAKLGSLNGIMDAARCMLNGIGTEENSKRAIKYYTKAARLYRSEEAMFMIALFFLGSFKGTRNTLESFKWLNAAAEANSADGMYLLAMIHEVYDNYEIALRWYRTAAIQFGHKESQIRLAKCYEHGFRNLITKDINVAICWYAASNGKSENANKLKTLQSGEREAMI